MLNKVNDINKIRQLIEIKAYQPFIQKYLEKPWIDEDKLLLLWGLFNELEISTDERNHYILSTMLVQIALDTHEKVSNISVDMENSDLVKNRQLTVLAGDYYSGLYYQVLAEVGNIQMIRALSSAVKRMNDHKILLYQHMLDNTTALLRSAKAVEASLLYKIAEYYQKPIWMNAAENILLLKRLYREREQYMSKGKSIIMDGIRNILFPDLKSDVSLTKDQRIQMINMMNSCIEYVVQSVKKSKDELPITNIELHQRISDMLSYTERKEMHL